MKISKLAISIVALLPALASANCEINSSDLNFGSFIGVNGYEQLQTSTILNVRCDDGVPYEVRPDADSYSISAGSVNLGNLELYKDASRTQRLLTTSHIQGVGNGTWQQVPVYSSMAKADQTKQVAAARYAEDVEFIVTW